MRTNGGAGTDTLGGGNGDDVLEAGENYNGPATATTPRRRRRQRRPLRRPRRRRLDGGGGNDLLVSSVPVCQGHTFDGGAGQDTVSYARSTPCAVDLGGTGGPPGCATPDQIHADNENLEGSDGPTS